MNEVQSLPIEGYSSVDQFIEALFAQPSPEHAVWLLEQEYAKLQASPETAAETASSLTQLLVGFWQYFQSIVSVRRDADFQDGLLKIQAAKEGFEALGLEVYASLATGFQLYYQAVMDIRSSNYQMGLERIKASRDQFNRSPTYGQYYAPMIDALEAEGFFVGGINYLLQLDHENAQINLEKAVKASKQVAVKHCEPDSAEYHLYEGLAFFYTAYSGFFTQMNHLSTLDFAYFGYTDNESATIGAKAIESLAKSIEIGEVANNNLRMAKIVSLLSQVVYKVGQTMLAVLKGEPAAALVYDVALLKKTVASAHKFSIEIGDTGLALARLSKQIAQTISHVEDILPHHHAHTPPKENTKLADNNAQIKQLIQDGKVGKALEEMLKMTVDVDLFNELVVMKGRLSLVKKELRLGTMKTEDAWIEENKIAAGILSILEE